MFAAALVLAGATGLVRAQDAPAPEAVYGDLISTFEVEHVGGREVIFHWDVIDPDLDMSCTLNADGDRVMEYSLPDCEDDRTQRHVYDEDGTYLATFIARGGGVTEQANLEVTVVDQP